MTLVSHVEQTLYLEDVASIARYDEHFARDDPHTVITTTPTALRALLRTIKTGSLDRPGR